MPHEDWKGGVMKRQGFETRAGGLQFLVEPWGDVQQQRQYLRIALDALQHPLNDTRELSHLLPDLSPNLAIMRQDVFLRLCDVDVRVAATSSTNSPWRGGWLRLIKNMSGSDSEGFMVVKIICELGNAVEPCDNDCIVAKGRRVGVVRKKSVLFQAI
uniref:Uncharacterized protein n=1 Tax=Moniliophthora roreri TaxID=221103 RepID=A0A0W0FXG2_MONRR